MAGAGNNLLDAALAYAELGYRVFPCAPGTKVPLTGHGLLDASSDADQIEKWWSQSPSANVAIATQGLLVVDIDGAQNPWLIDQPEKMLELAVAPLSLTANGGRQYVFRQPPGQSFRNTTGRIAPHVDTRADGGYIVAPPSVLGGGKVYRWQPTMELGLSPAALPVPPTWLLALLDPVAPAAPSSASANAIPDGQRNATLARLAGTMRRVGMTQTEILAALHRVNADRCQPPLNERELDRIAASIARYEPNQIATAVAEGHWDQMAQAGSQTTSPPSVRELMGRYPQLREPVLHGLLRRGETMNVISAPKVGKSWLVIDLALSVATGRPWLDSFQAERGDVLILDNELHGETSANRIPRVAEARGVPVDSYADHVFVQNLRGQLQDVFSLGRYFDGLPPGRFNLVILDAFYRFMPRDMDENDNGTMAGLYNQLDRYADRLGCCFVLIHHTTKGNQSQKSVTDVGAGAGSQSRATDTHLVLRPHEETGAVVLDAAVRSWAPPQPVCMRWAFPIWTAAPDLDPAALRSDKPKRRASEQDDLPPESQVSQFVQQFVSESPQTRSHILRAATAGGVSGRAAQRLLHAAEDAGLIHRWSYGSHRPTCYATIPKPSRQKESTHENV